MDKLNSGAWIIQARKKLCGWFGTQTPVEAIEKLKKTETSLAVFSVVELIASAMADSYTDNIKADGNEKVPIMITNAARSELRDHLLNDRRTGEGYTAFILWAIKESKNQCVFDSNSPPNER